LSLLARGGVYLAGGVIVKLLPRIDKARFREAFCAKSPHSALMMKIPVNAPASDRLEILGAAKIAAAR
jgi:glucokinase